MSNLYETLKEEIEVERKLKDRNLFMQLLPLFENMSKKGKVATIETLSCIIGLDLVIKEE